MNSFTPLDLKSEILQKIKKKGGWANCHTHLDRAYTLQKNSYALTDKTLQEKWALVDAVKRKSSVTYSESILTLKGILDEDSKAVPLIFTCMV